MPFTKVTWLVESVSLLPLSGQLLLLPTIFCRCLSSCLFFFSSLCCSFFCFLDAWKGRIKAQSWKHTVSVQWGKVTHWKGNKHTAKQLPGNVYSRLLIRTLSCGILGKQHMSLLNVWIREVSAVAATKSSKQRLVLIQKQDTCWLSNPKHSPNHWRVCKPPANHPSHTFGFLLARFSL